jgi:hypothetical protein
MGITAAFAGTGIKFSVGSRSVPWIRTVVGGYAKSNAFTQGLCIVVSG